MLYITHVEKVYETEQSHKSVKAQVAVRVVLQKIESNHHTMITSWNSKTSQVSNLLSKFSQKCEPKNHVDSGHENKKSEKCRICDKSFSNKGTLKNMLEKFMRLNNHTKEQNPQVAIRVVLKKSDSKPLKF